MAESGSNAADKSVQVKLVLLGASLAIKIKALQPCIVAMLTTTTGEAAVGKSSVVLRFVRHCF